MQPIKVALVDLYNNEPNQGMGCLKAILDAHNGTINGQPLEYNVFETRYKAEIPNLDYDVYISTGGPGSPFEGVGSIWEMNYFDLLEKIWNHNQRGNGSRKYVFFICHSFQLMVRFFRVAQVTRRKSRSFGILPVHKEAAGFDELLLKGLDDPFYGADFRAFQVVQPNRKAMAELGATILSLEKIRPHVPLERAIMGIRISDEMVGFQFHPEADPASMMHHFKQPERKRQVVDEYGEDKYNEMITRIEDPDYITRTHRTILPTFVSTSIRKLRPELN